MKRIWLCLLVLYLGVAQPAFGIEVEIPPLPKEDLNEEKIAIVVLEDKWNEEQIQQLVQQYPTLEIRHYFTHALNGFSVKGKVHELRKLNEVQEITMVSEVNPYHAMGEGSIPYIGGEDVRSYFDAKNERLTGKGVTVGVIDTGIDYNHPDLKGSYSGGKDFVDGDSDPMETHGRHELDTVHGTHVAGIIAADGKFQGVAPDANIIAYRALGPGGYGTTEQVIAAIEQAIKDKVDVLNLSLGSSVNGPDLPVSIALNQAVKNGIVAVTSNGNTGPRRWTVGSPGTASEAISVGASTPPLRIPVITYGLEDKEMTLQPLIGSEKWSIEKTYELANGGIGQLDELKDSFGKIALVERGSLTFTEKVLNAEQMGAQGVIIYNNTEGSFIGNLEKQVSIPVASITKKEGEALLSEMKKGDPMVHMAFKEEEDLLADFSSRGPVTSTWDIKPDVVAPGVAINSTVPKGYLSLQGTSMAAPHVAGAAALLLQAHPDWTPEEVKAALMNTSKVLTNKEGGKYHTFEQGAGRIQLLEAVQTESLVMPGSLELGKYTDMKGLETKSAQLKVKNVGKNPIKYSFAVPNHSEVIRWQLPQSFDLQPGEEKEVTVTMTLLEASDKESIYDGYLEMTAGKQLITIPYLFVVNEPDYPRVMGFNIGPSDQKGMWKYEMYLPGGADEMGIALYNPDTLQFQGFLDWKRNVHHGMVSKELDFKSMPKGAFKAIIFAKKSGQQDILEIDLYIPKPGDQRIGGTEVGGGSEVRPPAGGGTEGTGTLSHSGVLSAETGELISDKGDLGTDISEISSEKVCPGPV
ncbi:serine protease Vpr [Bacillus carboniphilus]|uniref:Serine protease Vpr n=1 Tax=Bacillus carboniphilus TaxID=86663 RepID=A0ABN0VXU3_9BACI